MAVGGGMVFEPHAGAGGGDVVFCVAIALLTLLSTVIFGEGKRPRRGGRGSGANGPVFVGGKGCGCGGCRAGAGVCGTYLS
jgi:hypothetical protein